MHDAQNSGSAPVRPANEPRALTDDDFEAAAREVGEHPERAVEVIERLRGKSKPEPLGPVGRLLQGEPVSFPNVLSYTNGKPRISPAALEHALMRVFLYEESDETSHRLAERIDGLDHMPAFLTMIREYVDNQKDEDGKEPGWLEYNLLQFTRRLIYAGYWAHKYEQEGGVR